MRSTKAEKDCMPQNNTPTEAQECEVLVAYMRVKGYKFTHIANETGRGRNAAMMGLRNKRMGVSKGFPDYLVIVDGNFIAIEMKRTKGSSTSQEQKDWIDALTQAGVEARICKGADEAIKFIKIMEGN